MKQETHEKAKRLQGQIRMLENFFCRYNARLSKASEADVTIHVILREEDAGTTSLATLDEEIVLKDKDYCVVGEVMNILKNTLDKLKKELEEL